MKLNIRLIWFTVVALGGMLASYLIFTFQQNEAALINQGQATMLWIQNSLAEKIAINKLRANRMVRLQNSLSKNNPSGKELKERINFPLLASGSVENLGIKANGDGGSKYIDFVKVGDSIYYYSNSMKSLLSDIIREDFFDIVALVDKNQLHYQSKARMLNEIYNDSILAYYTNSNLGVNHTQVYVTDEKYEAFIRPIQFHGRNYLLLGLMKASSFDKIKRQVPFSILNIVFLLLLLIISSIPIIRVFSLASGDQLSKSHVLECGISIILLATVLGLVISYSGNTIILRSNHQTEILDELDPDEGYSIIAAKVDSFFVSMQDVLANQIENDTANADPRLNEYLVMHEDSGEVLTFAFDDVILTGDALPKGVLFADQRHYFMVHHNKYGTTKSIAENNFYMGAHYSYSMEEFEGVISKKHGGKVHAITFPLSAIDTIVEESQKKGIHYMLIDYKGKMLYHQSDIKRVRNLQEEIGLESRFMTLLNGNPKSTRPIDFSFRGSDYTGYLKPLTAYTYISKNKQSQELYYLLAYSDVNQPLIIESAATGNAVVLVSGNVIMVVFMAILMAAGAYKSQRLSFAKFSYDWFRPSIRNYNQLRVINVYLLLHCVYLILIGIVFHTDIFFISLITLESIVFIGLYRYLLLIKSRILSHEFNYFFVAGSTTVMLLFWGLIFYYCWRTDPLFYISFIIISISLRFLFIKFRLTKDVDEDDISVVMAVKQFNRTLVLWVVTVAFLPTIIIYNTSVNLERRVWKELAMSLDESATAQNDSIKSDTGNFRLVQRKRHDFYRLIRLMPNFMAVDDKRVTSHQYQYVALDVLQSSIDEKWQVMPLQGLLGFVIGTIFFLLAIYYIAKGLINRIYFITMVQIKSELRGKDLEDYIKIKDDLNLTRLFVVGLPFSGRTTRMAPWLKNQTEHPEIFDLATKHHLKALETFCQDHDNLKGELQSGNYCIIIKNFNSLMLDLDRLICFLESLEYLVAFDSIKIIIYSNSTANEIIEMLRDYKTLLSHYPEDRHKEIEVCIDKIEYLLASFPTLLFRLSGRKDTNLKKYISRELKYGGDLQLVTNYAEEMETMVYKVNNKLISTRYMRYIDKLPQAISSLIQHYILKIQHYTLKIEHHAFEQYINQMQSFNKGYYLAIWNSLTLREKHVVYDLAKNGFANYTNKDKLNRLIRKGLVKVSAKANRIRLLNSSFRNFVLTIISKQEVEGFKRIVRKEGNWQSVRFLLGTVVLGILVFIYFADPSFMNKTFGVLGSILAIIGLIAKTYMQLTSGSLISKKSAGGGGSN